MCILYVFTSCTGDTVRKTKQKGEPLSLLGMWKQNCSFTALSFPNWCKSDEWKIKLEPSPLAGHSMQLKRREELPVMCSHEGILAIGNTANLGPPEVKFNSSLSLYYSGCSCVASVVLQLLRLNWPADMPSSHNRGSILPTVEQLLGVKTHLDSPASQLWRP